MRVLTFTPPDDNYRGLWFKNLEVFTQTTSEEAYACLLGGARKSHLLHLCPRIMAAAHAVFEGFMERLVCPFQVSILSWSDLFEKEFLAYDGVDDFNHLYTPLGSYSLADQLNPAGRSQAYMQDRWLAFQQAIYEVSVGMCSGWSVSINHKDAYSGDCIIQISPLCVPRNVTMSRFVGSAQQEYTGFSTTSWQIPDGTSPIEIGQNCQPTLRGAMVSYGEDVVLVWVKDMLVSLGASSSDIDARLTLPQGNYCGWGEKNGPLDLADDLWDGTKMQLSYYGTKRLNLDALWTMQALLGYMTTNFAKSAAQWKFKNVTHKRTTTYEILRNGTIMDHRTTTTEEFTESISGEMNWSRSVSAAINRPVVEWDPSYCIITIRLWELQMAETMTAEEAEEKADIEGSRDCPDGDYRAYVNINLKDSNLYFEFFDADGYVSSSPGTSCYDDGITKVVVVERATVCEGVLRDDDDGYNETACTKWLASRWWPIKI